jgi:hypothetical protein
MRAGHLTFDFERAGPPSSLSSGVRRGRAFMNKWQIICPVAAMLVVLIVFGSIHMRGERRYLVSAVTQQIDGHAPQIGELLAGMRGSNATVVEDAAFQELQAIPSTSLISRSMIRVTPAGDGRLQCVVDTSSLGIPPRTLRSSR